MTEHLNGTTFWRFENPAAPNAVCNEERMKEILAEVKANGSSGLGHQEVACVTAALTGPMGPALLTRGGEGRR